MLYKKKTCKSCGKPRYIFSKGRCKYCVRKEDYKKPKTRKIRKQEGVQLSEHKAYIKAYMHRGGVMYLSGEKVSYSLLKPSNKAHVIPKGLYRYFKYYWKNIVFLTLGEHNIWDQSSIGGQSRGREIVKHYLSGKSNKEKWKMLIRLEKELKQEYKEWVKNNKNEYKI